MKRSNLLKTIMILAGAIFIGSVSTTAAFSAISGSAHDFSGSTWNLTGQLCVVCHTPHNAQVGAAPLWNHNETSAAFTPYASSTLNAVVGQPNGLSKACLSCHDGTVAVDAFGGNTGGSRYVTGRRLLGTDLSNDHPVSFTYDAALATADGKLADPASADSGLGGSIAAKMLRSGRVECGSCHDPHNGSGVEKFLVKSNAASALCLTCHRK